MVRLAWLAIACVFCNVCWAQGNSLAALNQRAVRAYQSKDYATFLAAEKQLLSLTPGDTRTIYNTACGEALAGHAAESIKLLDQLLTFKIDFGPDRDKDLEKIHQAPEWKPFLDRLAALRQPLVRSSTAFILPDRNLLATSVAVDEQTGDVYIGSARERKIVKRTRNGVLSDFATDKDGLLAVWSLLIDPIRKQLIVSTAAIPFMQDFTKEDAGKSGICIFDLATGKLLRKAFLEHHFLTSSVIDKSGNVFVVDSSSHEIYRLRRGSTELELFISSVQFQAPRGIALSADERTLYVSDYVEGIWAIEVLSNDRHHLDAPVGVWTGGLDGLTRVPGGFIAIENGVQPVRVVRIRLDEKAEKIASLEIMESNHPEYAGPIQGTLSGDDFLYIANSQLALGNLRTGDFAADVAKPTTVLRLPIGK